MSEKKQVIQDIRQGRQSVINRINHCEDKIGGWQEDIRGMQVELEGHKEILAEYDDALMKLGEPIAE